MFQLRLDDKTHRDQRAYQMGHVKHPTPRTLRMAWLIWGYYDARKNEGDIPPTVREVAEVVRDKMGTRSHSNVYRVIRMLEYWGVIANDTTSSRGRTVRIPFQQWLGG